MMNRTAAYLLGMVWGAIPALTVFLCLGPWRRRRLRERGLESPRLRETVLALFWMFCGGMAVLTLTPRWVVWSLVDLLHGYRWNVGDYPFFERGAVNLKLFQTFRFSSYILLGNLVMFIPFGFFGALLWRGWTLRRSLLAGLCGVIVIECCQLCVGRAFDIDDVLLNTWGVLAGFLLWKGLAPETAKAFRVREREESEWQ